MNDATAPNQPKRRPWLWILPLGCLGLLVLAGGALFAMLSLVNGVIQQADAYTVPLQRAQASADVRRLLGEPVEAGWFTQGNINFKNDEGEAELSIPLQGPRGSAILHVEATKQAGDWAYQRMDVVAEAGDEAIDRKRPPTPPTAETSSRRP
jgi:hypothetical protein